MALNFRPRRSLRNPLIQRVRRHASFSTLFRSPDEPIRVGFQTSGGIPSHPSAAEPTARTSPLVVSASLIPTTEAVTTIPVEPSEAPLVMPTEPAATSPQAQPAQVRTPPQEAAARTPGQQPIQRTPVPPVEAPARQTLPGIQPQREAAEPSTGKPAASPEPQPPEDEDRVWRRLQNIFRKHEEKRQAEEEQTPLQPSEPEASPERPDAGSPAQIQRAEETSVSKAPPIASQRPADPSRAVIQEQPELGQPGRLPAQPDAPAADPPRLPTITEFEASDRELPQPQKRQPRTQEQAEITPAAGRPEQAAAQPTVEPVGKTDTEAEEKPVGEPEIEPEGKPVEQSLIQPMAEPTARSAAGSPEQPAMELVQRASTAEDREDLLESEPTVDQDAQREAPGDEATTTPGEQISPADGSALRDRSTAVRPVQRSTDSTVTPAEEPSEMPAPVRTPGAISPGAPTQVPIQRHEAPGHTQPVDSGDSLTQEEETVIIPPQKSTLQAAASDQPAAPHPEIEAGEVPQGLPLEDAWPVQRMDDASADKPTPTEALAPPSASLATSPEVEQVSQLLKSVSPGQPTDSSVEVVTPRRPRPAPATQPEADRPADVQARKEPGPAAPRVEQAGGIDTTRPAPAPVPTIPTEIGPLPEDLWRLIGQEPPQSTPIQEPAIPAVNLQATEPPTVQRQPMPAGRPETPARPEAQASRQPVASGPVIATYTTGYLSPEDLPDVLQMQTEETSAAETTQVEDISDQAPAAEINVDELTRKVYQEIKRRLSGEWERIRRRI